MWLVYLRFDNESETRNAFVNCSNKAEVDEVLLIAKKLFPSFLTEYVSFYSGRSIRAKDKPNFSENLIYSYASFLQACDVSPHAPGQSWEKPEDANPSPPGTLPQLPVLLLGAREE